MEEYGLKPVDFAYPSGHDDPAATQALQAYFGHIRDTHYAWDDAIYYQYGSGQAFIAGMGIDDLTYGNSIDDIYNGLSRAKQEDTVLITYGHTPVVTVTGDYQTSHDRLEKILQYISDNNMKCYTISELP
jgi:Ca2+-binding RTX toxin-like protein